MCRDMGMVYIDGQSSLCPNCGPDRLLGASGLPGGNRSMTFANTKPYPHVAQMIQAAYRTVTTKPVHGMFIMAGSNGIGKTHVASAMVIASCLQLIPALYTTSDDLLNAIRAGIPTGSMDENRRRFWEIPVLVVDEMTRYNQTEFAIAEMVDLVGWRYSNYDRYLTVFAYNTPANLPPYISSRFRDGRCSYFEIQGPDLRPLVGVGA